MSDDAPRPPEPAPPAEPRLGVLARLWPYVRRHGRLMLAAAALLPLLSGVQLAQPYLVRLAIDRHLSPGAGAGATVDLTGLWWIVGAFVVLMLADVGLRFGQLYVMQLAGQRIMHDLRVSIFEHVQRLSMSFFDRNPVGRVMTRVTSDVETLNDLMSQGIVAIARDVVTLIGIVAVMLWIDWRLALTSFVVFPLLLVLLAFLRVRLRAAYDRSRTLVARVNAFLQESISGMAVVQAFHQQERHRDEFRELREELLDVELTGVRYSSWLSATVQAATTVSTAAVLAYGGLGILEGAVTIGVLVQFLEYLRRFYQPLEDLSDKYDALQRAAASSTKIFRLLDVEPGVAEAERPAPLPAFTGDIVFEDVTFAYEAASAAEAVEDDPSAPLQLPGEEAGAAAPAGGGSPSGASRSGGAGAAAPGAPASGASRSGPAVLKGLDLRIRSGEKVALVGATGAGKSSVVKLLQRFYEPQRGSVAIDGVDVRELSLAELRRSFGTVPQDVFLFTDTIAANIGLGAEEVGRGDVEAAARLVEADGFIRELPRGYDTVLGERGSSLSFGERQLLAFARAMAFRPPVLILDEATSSVDSDTEARIQRALERVVADRTAIIVAHRLSTIRRVDRIVVLHHGEVREQGTHEELMELDGIYATLYRLQFQAGLDGRDGRPGEATGTLGREPGGEPGEAGAGP